MPEKLPVIIIAGPTAAGKTGVSIEIAKKIDGEIISADSMQIYKYMDIGSAKITKKQMQGIKHYLIDELYPDEEYSVAVFQKMAKTAIKEIAEKGKTPIIAGGTGFYINALLYDNEFTDIDIDTAFRQRLYHLAEEKGNRYIHKMLREIDPASAEIIHENNIKKVIRALEFYEKTNTRISDHNEREKKKEAVYNAEICILNMDRASLYQRINDRVDEMIALGLVDEVKGLLDMNYSRDLVSMQGLGYKEIARHLIDGISLEEAVCELKKGTRHFAKRQITWFSHRLNGKWYDTASHKNAEALADKIISKYCKKTK